MDYEHEANRQLQRPFLSHLRERRGKTITITTMRETLTGTLSNIFSDHILLNVEGRPTHIPFTSILYFHD
ncbi:DUF2642 domain-containing protein [Ammoniphilus sp. 3BR4]|uniref:DUF2642 domain-containing protein n=1 Tax=Ammoniphilus sp. 3BR4 TaxID=3158265 RepID=UPI003464F204